MDKKEVSPNTARYRFRLPRSDSMLGLPIGQHLSVQVDVNGKLVQRSYTPTTSDDEIGFFDLVVKTYPDGAVSSYIGAMKIGDMLQVKGPKGQMRYHDGLARKIGMVAGGTGLTPCMQIIRQILKDDDDNTQVSFIYANTGQDDILLKHELDKMAEKHPEKFRIWYFLSNPPEGWEGGAGLVSKDAIQDFLPEHAPDTKILMCGPPPMINACKKHLCELGFPEPRPMSKPEDVSRRERGPPARRAVILISDNSSSSTLSARLLLLSSLCSGAVYVPLAA